MPITFVSSVFRVDDFNTHISTWIQSQLFIILYVVPDVYPTALEYTSSVNHIQIRKLPNWNEEPISWYDETINQLPETRNHDKDTLEHIWNTHRKIWVLNHCVELTQRSPDPIPFNMEPYYMYIDFDVPRLIQDVFSWSRLRSIYNCEHLYLPQEHRMYLPGCWDKASPDTDFQDNIHWRFCGTMMLGNKHSIQELYNYYHTHFTSFVNDACNRKLSWEVNFWAWLESNTNWTPEWYPADHNDRMFIIPKVFGFDLIANSGCQTEYSYPPLTPYRPMSAAYAYYQGKHYLNTRYVNYWIYERGYYYYPEDEHVIRTYNMCSTLDCPTPGVPHTLPTNTIEPYHDWTTVPMIQNDANIKEPTWIPKTYNLMEDVIDPFIVPNTNVFSEGIEDIRLYVSQETGDLCFIGSTLEYSYNDRIRMIRGKYDIELFQCKDVQLLIPPYDTWCEKNWAPIPLPDGSDGFVYQWYPLEIGKIVGDIQGSPLGKMEIVVRKERTDERLIGMKGSTTFTPYGESGLIGVIHFSEENTPRKYFHRIIILNKQTFDVMRCSPIFCLLQPNVEFCVGFRAWNGKFGFWISQMDRDPLYLETSSDFLWK